MNESFLRTISATTRKNSDGSTSANTTTIKENKNSLDQSVMRDREVSAGENPNPKPRRLSTAKKSKKKEDQ